MGRVFLGLFFLRLFSPEKEAPAAVSAAEWCGSRRRVVCSHGGGGGSGDQKSPPDMRVCCRLWTKHFQRSRPRHRALPCSSTAEVRTYVRADHIFGRHATRWRQENSTSGTLNDPTPEIAQNTRRPPPDLSRSHSLAPSSRTLFLWPLSSSRAPSIRLKVGITDGFVRVSCGVENTDDLVAALQKGLDDL